MPKLGVNIDHVATLRQARRSHYPDPVVAAALCEKAGCDSIVCHLREDRRHINDKDLHRLRESVTTKLNLEMSIAPEIVDIACEIKPEQATIVPEKREEITTEGGLEVSAKWDKIKKAVDKLKKAGTEVSLFIDPDIEAIKKSRDMGVHIVELHTGAYANAKHKEEANQLDILKKTIDAGMRAGLVVNAGHGLNYKNVIPIARIKDVNELNIGHSIISQAVFIGLEEAVRQMKRLMS
ncbi:MAG: pyridoxine 5'-phosphate synthase [Candidatus Omnitrophica bacterium]|nr:pyridoxine 5'-phosphate synthase [Candidatus Omnitrophota bacterium]